MVAVEMTLACGAAIHRIRWDAGVLALLDHEDDDAERALAGLGADRPACVRLRDIWTAYEGDVALVTLGRRPGDAGLGIRDESLARQAFAIPPRARPERRDDLLALLSLPAPFLDRLVITSFARAADAWAREQFRVAHGLRLGAALSSRASPALRRFCIQRSDVGVTLTCAPTAPAEAASIQAVVGNADELRVSAALPLSWLSTVWGPGLSEAGGGLVLAITGGEGDRLEVETAQWEQVDARLWRAVPLQAVLVRDRDFGWTAR
jgi:hypothetical protein